MSGTSRPDASVWFLRTGCQVVALGHGWSVGVEKSRYHSTLQTPIPSGCPYQKIHLVAHQHIPA
jgi:hypothetical protein